MQEIKYLTEKDMEYFYKLEEQGEAVIIRLGPEQLLSLDLSELDRRKTDADSEISEAEVRQWLQQHSLELQQRYEENELIMRENRWMKSRLDFDGESHDSDGVDRKADLYSAKPGKRARETIVKFLQQTKFDEEQARIINNAICCGIDDERLLIMLRSGLDAEKIQKLCDALV